MMKELLFLVAVVAFAYSGAHVAEELKEEMTARLTRFATRMAILEQQTGGRSIFYFKRTGRVLFKVIPTLRSRMKAAGSLAIIAIAAVFVCFPDVAYASEPKAVTATVTSVPVDGEALNQYGETAEEEAERKALEAAQKEVVVSNNLKKAENQKVLIKKKKAHRKLRKEISETENAVDSIKKEKKSALSCLGAFQNTVLYSCVKNTYDSAISDKKSDLSEIKKEKKSVKDQMKSLKEEPKDIVFDPQDVTKESNISTEEMTKILEGTSLQKLAPAFTECEKKYGVNAIFLCSIAALESNWGNSRRAVEDNNYTGLGVYSDTAVGINSDTPEGNIHATAQRLAENYLKEDGMFYNGLSVFAVNTKYCVGCTWGMKVTNIGYRLMDKVQADVSGAVME